MGLELAGFEHVALVEVDRDACSTLRLNRPHWPVLEHDIRRLSAVPFRGVDLLAAGIPCPPFSKAGQQLGDEDERNLFPDVLRIVSECRPKAVMIENVPGLLEKRFDSYRRWVTEELFRLGYISMWRRLNASDFGVPQLRPRVICVAFPPSTIWHFRWPGSKEHRPPSVGEVLYAEMAQRGWPRAQEWARAANRIAPTLVGGSKKHGGPDLGPTRARREWAGLGVDGVSLANDPPDPTFEGMPRLTVKMAALLQGFPPDWKLAGKKTSAYRQVGNAFPPPVAEAMGRAIRAALLMAESEKDIAQTGS